MRILFIGGTGNLSGECTALLHERGHEIIVVTRGQSEVPSAYRAVVADRKDPAAMRAALAGLKPDVVIDFIAYEVPDVQMDYEIFGNSLRQYIFISSTVVYVKPAPRLPMTEETPLGNPFWPYAVKKLECEEWLRGRRREGFPVTIVRPSHTYGPRWFPNMVSSAGYTLAARMEAGKPVFVPDDGENPWTLTAASEFAVGVAGLAGNERAVGEAFHITSDESLTWNQIYAATAEALGVKSPNVLKIPTSFICEQSPKMIGPLRGDKACPGVFDNSKIKRFVPDFCCRKPFREGIRESVAWYRAHPDKKWINPDADATFDQVTAAWLKRQS